MPTTYHRDLVQGSDDWHAARCGLLTASEMRLIITPTLKVASNDKERSHLYELLAQRVTGYVEPSYVSDSMLRGKEDEIEARALYADHFAPIDEVGFVTNDDFGFTIGYSPDGLVGDDGQVEFKSRMQKHQMQTIVEDKIPDEYVLQLQTGLLVTGRKWVDFGSFCGGLPFYRKRVYPDMTVMTAILQAAAAFEQRLAEGMAIYRRTETAPGVVIPPRRIYEDIIA